MLSSQGAFAMSQPAWDPSHDSVWYSDGNSGFYDVRLTNGLEKLFVGRPRAGLDARSAARDAGARQLV